MSFSHHDYKDLAGRHRIAAAKCKPGSYAERNLIAMAGYWDRRASDTKPQA